MSLPILRRAALAGSLALAAPGLAQGPGVTRMRVGIIPIVDVAPLQAAMREGYFAAEGLEIDTSPAPGGAAALPALAAGQFRAVFTNTVSAMMGIREGIDFRFVAGATRSGNAPPDIMAMVVRKGSGIASGRELEGKRVASNTRNNIVWLRGVDWIQKTGGNPARVNIVEVPFPQMADALAGRQIDAAIINEPFLSAALQTMGDRLERIGWVISETTPGGTVAQYVGMKDDIARNPELFEKFSRALYKGVDWVAANLGQPPLFELMSAYTRVPVDRLRSAAMPTYDKMLAPAAIEEIIATMARFGQGGRFPPVRELIHRTALG